MRRSVAVSLILIAVLALTQIDAVRAQEDAGPWRFEIGTGLHAHFVEGDVGFTSFRGAEKADVDLSAGDIEEFTESALQVQASAAKGRWTFHLGYAHLKLEDESTIDVPGGALPPLKSKSAWITTSRKLREPTSLRKREVTGGARWQACGIRNMNITYGFPVQTPSASAR